jgi:hypothetical protein
MTDSQLALLLFTLWAVTINKTSDGVRYLLAAAWFGVYLYYEISK